MPCLQSSRIAVSVDRLASPVHQSLQRCTKYLFTGMLDRTADGNRSCTTPPASEAYHHEIFHRFFAANFNFVSDAASRASRSIDIRLERPLTFTCRCAMTYPCAPAPSLIAFIAPIGRIVPAFIAGLGKIANFILLDSPLLQSLHNHANTFRISSSSSGSGSSSCSYSVWNSVFSSTFRP